MNLWKKVNSRVKRYALMSGFVVFLVIPGMVRCAGSVDAQAEVKSGASASYIR